MSNTRNILKNFIRIRLVLLEILDVNVIFLSISFKKSDKFKNIYKRVNNRRYFQ